MSTIIKTTGRPRLGDQKKVKVCVCLNPKVYSILKKEVEDGFGSNISGIICQVLRRTYGKSAS